MIRFYQLWVYCLLFWWLKFLIFENWPYLVIEESNPSFHAFSLWIKYIIIIGTDTVRLLQGELHRLIEIIDFYSEQNHRKTFSRKSFTHADINNFNIGCAFLSLQNYLPFGKDQSSSCKDLQGCFWAGHWLMCWSFIRAELCTKYIEFAHVLLYLCGNVWGAGHYLL